MQCAQRVGDIREQERPLFGDIAKKVDECANALKSYQLSYPAASGSTAK